MAADNFLRAELLSLAETVEAAMRETFPVHPLVDGIGDKGRSRCCRRGRTAC